jgi:energy-coupling factor transporter ATP-binding protein EcfA2
MCHPWLEYCETWIVNKYQNILGLKLPTDSVRLRWLSENSIVHETAKGEAQGLVVEDDDIGWLFFLLPYKQEKFEYQVNQSIGMRSQLLREVNYSGNPEASKSEDKWGSWRIGLVWLVNNDENEWDRWQYQIQKLRCESGFAEEISFDAVRVKNNDIKASLDSHGLPRLLLNTRSLLAQSAHEAEMWLSADAQVASEMESFSQQFSTTRERYFAREVELQIQSYQHKEIRNPTGKARCLKSFCVKNFRNLEQMQIDAEDHSHAQAIVLFGPNGTGKSSFAEAISLAAFRTSTRMATFLDDKDLGHPSVESYLNDYLSSFHNISTKPSFIWNDTETLFNLGNEDLLIKQGFEGVVLNQEDSIEFTKMSRDALAARILKGYSVLADNILGWLLREENKANVIKLAFTRKHGLSGATKLSATAYKGLAQEVLQQELQQPSPEFLEWLRFFGQISDEDGYNASKLTMEWVTRQSSIVDRLSGVMAKLQEQKATQQIIEELHKRLDEFDKLARKSEDLRQRVEKRIVSIRDQIDNFISQIDVWGAWIASQSSQSLSSSKNDDQSLKQEIESLAKKRTELEHEGKTLRGRLDLLDQVNQFLSSHWLAKNPDICPVCNSDLSDKRGIEAVVLTLQTETTATIEALRTSYVEIQKKQKELEAKLKASGFNTCPLSIEDQTHLSKLLQPFLSDGMLLRDYLIDSKYREQLKENLNRLRVIPVPPKPYTDIEMEAERLTKAFVVLAEEADKALEDPQALGEVKKILEQRLEKVLKDHLPMTVGKVWKEIILCLTTASWILPDDPPALMIEKRGKALSVQTAESRRYIRYIYNAAERHLLGLAWFFTYYLARKRFEEAWMLLDDPAQEMDQASFREFVRFLETLLRLHQKQQRPLTMIVALHQEGRALDIARASNGKLYLLGWKNNQQDSREMPSVKKIVLLAPGYHPKKPSCLFTLYEQ